MLGAAMPEMLGGSADLTGSNNTNHKASKPVTADASGGNYLHYGVREFGMSAMMNGIALHGGFVPYGGTFLVFSDYARNAVRMAALMKQRVVLVFTHDSIGLGEDGPTHQPIEHLASLRLIPNMTRLAPVRHGRNARSPGREALEHTTGPTSLVLTRQALPPMPRTDAAVAGDRSAAATCCSDCEGAPECVLIATGSEVGLAVDAAKTLTAQGRRVRVVSMPCTSLFDAQDATYRASVLPAGHAARRHRGGRARRLVALRRPRRRRDRHGARSAPRRRQETVRAFRLHGGPRGRDRGRPALIRSIIARKH